MRLHLQAEPADDIQREMPNSITDSHMRIKRGLSRQLNGSYRREHSSAYQFMYFALRAFNLNCNFALGH